MSEGGSRAFARVYDQYMARVYGFLGYRVSSRQGAEELTQLTFERALREWHTFDARQTSALAWLIEIARSLLVDREQRDRSSAREPLAGSEEIQPMHPGASGDERGHWPSPELLSALEGLPPDERELVALRFGGGLTGPEIARLTGLSAADVKQILPRALWRLGEAGELEPPDAEPTAGEGAPATPGAATAAAGSPKQVHDGDRRPGPLCGTGARIGESRSRRGS